MSASFLILAAALVLAALPLLALPLLARPGSRAIQRSSEALDHELRRLREDFEAGRIDAPTHQLQHDALAARLASLRQQPRPQRSVLQLMTLAMLVTALPAAVVAIYLQIGHPEALRMPTGGETVAHGELPTLSAPEMSEAIDSLARRMREQQDDLQGWVLLARAYHATERYALARDAFAEALRLAPTEPNLIIQFAEAIAMADSNRSLAGEPQRLLERALELDPDNQRAMWMLGVAARQQGDYASAAQWWEELLRRLPLNAPVRDAIQDQLTEARELMQGNGSAPQQSAAVAERSSGITVEIELDPDLQTSLPPTAVLFVFARPAEGPRMPVAIQRLPASALPVTVRLDDSHSMVDGLTLSGTAQVVVGARISISGDATPRSGDLEGLSDPLPGDRTASVSIRIDSVIP